MYRDTANALDEHDRAISAILIGEALIADCERAAAVTRDPDRHEQWSAVREFHDAYPEIWRQLDLAQRVLAGRGQNTARYQELRPHVRLEPATSSQISDGALDDARRAAAELKLAAHGADWRAIDQRTRGLVETPALRRRPRTALAVAIGAFAAFSLAAIVASTPSTKRRAADSMRDELIEIAKQRKLRIGVLEGEVGDRCDPPRAHELIRLLVLDGRGEDARQFAGRYLPQCGDDPVIEHWANAPLPKP